MSERVPMRLDEAGFFAWLRLQERRHELIDGVPVMMAGADARHDTIVVNILGALIAALRGKKCRPFTADTAIRIPGGNIRYPDVSVDCGVREPTAMAATRPTLVVEVLSPSTHVFDQDDKLEEYKRVSSIAYVLFINPLEPDARLHRRPEAGEWNVERVRGLDQLVALPAIDTVLTMAEIYESVTFSARPRLVVLDE